MKVYVVIGYDAHDSVILGVYDSLEKAEGREGNEWEDDYAGISIQQWEVK